MPRLPSFPLLALVALAGSATAQDLMLTSRPTRWRFTVERFSANSSNDLGLVGAHYDLLDVAPETLPGAYVGLGGYGAVTGTTGGLFFGGPTVGWLKELYPGWMLDVAVMAGGGGGGGADTGSGLFFRPHLAVEYAVGLAAVRLELAHLGFSNGDLDDTHLALGFSLPGELLLADHGRQPDEVPGDDLLWRRVRITPNVTRIYTSDNERTNPAASGAGNAPLSDDVELGGLALDYFLSESLFIPLELAGAIGGGVGGFAMAMGGIGGSLPLFERLRLEGRLLAGAGGGGDVDTGGGLLLKGAAGVSWAFGGNMALELLGGYITAPDGDLDGTTLTAGISWNPRSAELSWDYPRSSLDSDGLSASAAELDATRVQALHKSYFPASSAKTKNGQDIEEPIHMLGAGVTRPIELFDQDFALTGRLFTAYEGESGGYAEATGGLQYELKPFTSLRFHTVLLRAEVGAGGGGDVDVSSGLIYHLAAGWRFQYSKNLSFHLDVGSVESDRGSFEGESLTVGVGYMLNRAIFADG
ncbi:MAG: hypothetical protein AAF682_08455 [Planctomycetota bacterium]